MFLILLTQSKNSFIWKSILKNADIVHVIFICIKGKDITKHDKSV